MPALERIVRIGARAERSRLSVVTPFHRDDPTALLERLAAAPAGVEFILLDDGSQSASLIARVAAASYGLKAPATIIVRQDNVGRAAARNRLIEEARGDYVLFLDADMIPDAPDFLVRWLDVIEREQPYAAFGGLSVDHARPTRDTAFHHDLFANSDCRTATERAQDPARFTATANLLVRHELLQQIGFDDSFVGWGWEDVDWAIRTAERAPILHVDNPASHIGLDNVDTLLRKSREAGPNFARLAAKHPDIVTSFPAFRAARMLKRTPGVGALRGVFGWIARDPLAATPMPVRRAAFKLYRASHYAEHLA